MLRFLLGCSVSVWTAKNSRQAWFIPALGSVFSQDLRTFGYIVNHKKLEAGLKTKSAGIPSTLLLRIEAIGFLTLGLLR